MQHRLRDTADVGRDHWQSGSHRFDDAEAKRFGMRWRTANSSSYPHALPIRSTKCVPALAAKRNSHAPALDMRSEIAHPCGVKITGAPTSLDASRPIIPAFAV